MSHNIAHTTAFLYAGALQQKQIEPLCLDSWSGHTGFVQTCASFAEAIETWLATREDDNYPGVLAYEIIEPLGEWIVTEAGHPDTGAVLQEFQKRFLEWIKGTDEHGIKPTDRVLDAHGNVLQEGERTITTANYEITLDLHGEKNYGYFEHNTLGDELSGGLWYDEKKSLSDYDGVTELPKEAREALKADGFTSEEGCLDD